MAAKRREEFKRDAVRIAQTSGLTRRQVASDHGIGHSTLGKWIQVFSGDTKAPAQDAELLRENERLRKPVSPRLVHPHLRESGDPRVAVAGRITQLVKPRLLVRSYGRAEDLDDRLRRRHPHSLLERDPHQIRRVDFKCLRERGHPVEW